MRNLGIDSISLSHKNEFKNGEGEGNLYTQIRDRKFKLVYLTPEKLVKSPALMNVVEYMYHRGDVDRFVIDEVHCVSHWGQDFRKDYLHLDMLK